MSGLIGAITNNNKGIAGIAGGDATQSEYGASIVAMQFEFEGINKTSMSKIAPYIENSTTMSEYYYHIANHSHGGRSKQTLSMAIYSSFLKETFNLPVLETQPEETINSITTLAIMMMT